MDIKIKNGFVINPTIEVTPCIRISPFMDSDLGWVGEDPTIALNYLQHRFGQNYCLTIKARESIKLALSYYNLKKTDVVTIITTSGNYYVSGCVTRAIESICSWSREFVPATKIFWVIHEFGYPYKKLVELKKYGLPVIEDCALSFMSKDNGGNLGHIGDFVIYSLPKFFPMQVGGVLVSNRSDISIAKNYIPTEIETLILSQLSSFIPEINNMLDKRMLNYHYLVENLKALGITPFFPLEKGVYPGVFLFSWHANIDYPRLKEYMQKHGIESSVFYGENAFYIPLHNKLNKKMLDYMITLLQLFAS